MLWREVLGDVKKEDQERIIEQMEKVAQMETATEKRAL